MIRFNRVGLIFDNIVEEGSGSKISVSQSPRRWKLSWELRLPEVVTTQDLSLTHSKMRMRVIVVQKAGNEQQ